MVFKSWVNQSLNSLRIVSADAMKGQLLDQVPMYAEKMAGVLSQPYAKKLISMLKERHDVWAIDSKARLLGKLVRSLQAMSS